MGLGGTVSQATVVTGLLCALVVNAVFYLFFMHIVYLIMLTVPHPLLPTRTKSLRPETAFWSHSCLCGQLGEHVTSWSAIRGCKHWMILCHGELKLC